MSNMNSNHTTTEELITQRLTMHGITMDKILSALSKPTDRDGLVSGEFLDLALMDINKLIKHIDPTGSGIPEITLISNSIIDPYFQDSNEHILTNWDITDKFMARAHGGYPENSFTINKDVITKTGHYLLAVEVYSIPDNSELELHLNGEWKDTYKEPGLYYYEFLVENAIDDVIELRADHLPTGTEIYLSSVSLYVVSDRFYDYLIDKIKSLASIDAKDYVKLVQFEEVMESFTAQFTKITEAYLKQLESHIQASNPHKLTAKDIGAAEESHVHEGMITEETLVDRMNSIGSKLFAAKDHTHTDYLTIEQGNKLIASVLTEHIAELVSVDPLIVIDGPVGILPSRYAPTDVTEPLQLLLPTVISYPEGTTYDYRYGMVTTNQDELKTRMPRVFSADKSVFASIPAKLDVTTSAINARIHYHTLRSVKGYRIITKRCLLAEWSVYSGNTTFIHTVPGADFDVVEGAYVSEILFDQVYKVDSLAFLITDIVQDVDIDNWLLRIEIMYDDFKPTEFGLTGDGFKFCVSTKGANRIVEYPSNGGVPVAIEPEVIVANTPLYIYGIKELDDANPKIGYSYYSPEYSNVRRGIKMLVDSYHSIPETYVDGAVTFVHPAYGNLSLKSGYTDTASSLTNIYDSGLPGWSSDGTTKTVVIEQTILSDNVVLAGYALNWRNEDVDNIPEKWTLLIEGTDIDGDHNTVVFDSVEKYHPFYSVEDDDIFYHKKFDIPLHIKKITLTLEVTDVKKIRLNKFFLYLSERYHSIASNTTYLGLHEVSQMCLGRATYVDNVTGWTVENICIGRSSVIPVYNLNPTDFMSEYQIFNPFLSTDVHHNVQGYILEDIEDKHPSAYVSVTEPDKIKIYTEESYRYAVNVSRMW